MQGEKFAELTGKVTGTRVIVIDGQPSPAVETSFAGTSRMYGVEVTDLGTYVSQLQPSGTYLGEAQGVSMTKDGETIAWKGFGVGRPTGKGLGASYRYSIAYQTTSAKLAKLNQIIGIGEWEVDENGTCKGSTWEWK